jgi:hypothetical protein
MSIAMQTVTSPEEESRNLSIWLLVASPLVFGVIAAIVDQNVGTMGDEMMAAVAIGLFVVFGILVDIDYDRLEHAGCTPPCFWWFVLPPVYLWKRMNRPCRSRVMSGIFCASLIGGLAIQSPAVTNGCFTGFGLPACNAAVAAYEVNEAIDRPDQTFGLTMLQLHDVLQTAFDGVTRSCWGRAYRSDGTDHAYRYQFQLANRKLETTVQSADW